LFDAGCLISRPFLAGNPVLQYMPNSLTVQTAAHLWTHRRKSE